MELFNYQLLLPKFALVLARMAGVVLAVPMLSSSQIPRSILIWFVVVLSLMMFPAVHALLPESLTLGEAAAGMVGEFLIGELLGLGAGLIFFAAQIAGQVVSHQSGLALSAVFNPLFDEQSTVIDQIWFFSVLIFFLALRGHLAVAEVILTSFRQVPPLMLASDPALGDFALSIVRTIFDVAIRLAGPAILALLLSSLMMGFLTKTMPQLNVLSVGFAFKIAIALFIAAVTIRHAGGVVSDAVADGLDQLGALMQNLPPGAVHAG